MNLRRLNEFGEIVFDRRRWLQDNRPLIDVRLRWFAVFYPLAIRRFRLDDPIPAHGPSDAANSFLCYRVPS